MAARISNRRWLWRDLPRSVWLALWTITGLGILVYGIDWPALERMTTTQFAALKQQFRGAGSTVERQDAERDQKVYTGSIVFVPQRGDNCSQWLLDNRTGLMWDNGQVNCRQTVLPSSAIQATPTDRMLAIGRAFKGN